MTTKVVPGMLVAVERPELVAREAATRMGKAMRAAIDGRGRVAIALSGGNTPRAAYAALAEDRGIDWAKVDVFWVDERAVPPTDDRSNYRWAKETLLDRAPILEANVHRMRGEAAALDEAAREYEELLRRHVPPGPAGVPAFDVMVLGVGDDGHTASLFPGEKTVDVTDKLVVAVPAKPGREARLTLTAPVLEAARHAFVLAVGPAKHAPLERVWAVQGRLHETPARVIRGVKGAITWVIDRSAAGMT